MTIRAARRAHQDAHPRVDDPIRHGVASVTGHRRDQNEDASLAGPHWYVVADGMGGHAAGEVASRIVVDTFASIPPIPPIPPIDTGDADRLIEVRAAVNRAVADANVAVRRRGVPGMGSTLVGMTTVPTDRGPIAVVFHVGDSRCYRLVAGELRLLTRDHSHVQERIDAGQLTTEQARHHPLRGVVTRAIGPAPEVRAAVAVLDGRPSRFLLCTDGLTGVVGPQAIGRVLAGISSPADAARRLVELAIDGGGQDDVTALIVDLDPTRPATQITAATTPMVTATHR